MFFKISLYINVQYRVTGHIVPPPPPPPPRYTSSNISRTPWATDLKLSDNLNELTFEAKTIFQPPPPTLRYHSNVQSLCMFLNSTVSAVFMQSSPDLVTIAMSKVDTCFWKTHFGSFHAKAYLNSTFFLLFPWRVSQMESVVEIWVVIPLEGGMVTIFVSHSFSYFNDLNLDNTFTMATRRVSFVLNFYKISEKVDFVDFQHGEQCFWLLKRDSQSKIWNLGTTLKRKPWFPCKPIVVSGDSFLDKLS